MLSKKEGHVIYPMYAWQVKTDRFFNCSEDIIPVDTRKVLDTAQKWINYPTRMKISFPTSTILPKVQKIRLVPLKHLPRDVEIERKRKYYASIDFEKLVEDSGIQNDQIIPVEILEAFSAESLEADKIFTTKYFLCLEWFDNNEFDINNESGWLKMGKINDAQHPLPAFGFVPNVACDSETTKLIEDIPGLLMRHYPELAEKGLANMETPIYCWRLIAVWDFDYKSDKWIVTDLETYNTYKLPRIYFRFIAEDPFNYIKRLKDALATRTHSEDILKFRVTLDSFIYISGLANYSEKLMNRITEKVFSDKKFNEVNETALSKVKHEINIDYQRVNKRFELISFLNANPIEFSYLKSDTIKKQRLKLKPWHPAIANFKVLRSVVNFYYLYYHAKIITAMSKVVKECQAVEEMSLYYCLITRPFTIEEFHSTQQYAFSSVINHIKNYWPLNIATQLSLNIRGIGKGWMDLNTPEWKVFFEMKIQRLLQQIRFRMESSLIFLLQNSILGYTKMLCDPCKCFMHIHELGYYWPGTFTSNPYHQYAPPVFSLVINLSPVGYFYSTDPSEFLPTIIKIYHSALVSTTIVGVSDPLIMTKLVYARNLYLDPGYEIEELYHKQKAHLILSYQKAIIPLIAYGEKYNLFMDLYNLVIPDYIKDLRVNNASAMQIRNLIYQQKQLRRDLKKMLPPTIVIGPFFINVEPLKNFLIRKRALIITYLTEFMVDRLFEINEGLLSQFSQLDNRVSEKAISIEHVFELKKYVSSAPQLLETLEAKLRLMISEYDVVDTFYYTLPDDQFEMKWAALAYPLRIHLKISEASDQLKVDFEYFRKNQSYDIEAFRENIEDLAKVVEKFKSFSDDTQAVNISNDAKRIMEDLEYQVRQGNILQNRQTIFKFKPFSLEDLDNLIADFQPFYDLWVACGDFLKLYDKTNITTLVALDLEEVYKNVDDLTLLFENLKKTFYNRPGQAAVAEAFLENIERFKVPNLEIISCLKTEYWLLAQWQELAQRGKIDLKYSAAVTFLYCIKRGILDVHEFVLDIYKTSKEEAEALARQLLEDSKKKTEQKGEKRRSEGGVKRRARIDIIPSKMDLLEEEEPENDEYN